MLVLVNLCSCHKETNFCGSLFGRSCGLFFASKMVFLYACKILLMTVISNDTKIHNTAEIKPLKTNKEIFLTYNFVQWHSI